MIIYKNNQPYNVDAVYHNGHVIEVNGNHITDYSLAPFEPHNGYSVYDKKTDKELPYQTFKSAYIYATKYSKNGRPLRG